MISSVVQNAKHMSGKATSAGFKVLNKNLATLGGDFTHTLVQDHASLKINALIVSTLILILSRIGISYASAKKAENTPEEQYRRQEFIRTGIREIGGWTLSFVALRFFERQVRNWIKSKGFLGLEKYVKKPLGNYFDKIKNQVKSWANGSIQPLKPTRLPFEGLEQEFSHYDPIKYKGWQGTLIELFSYKNKTASTPKKIEKFHEWFPLLVGSIPSVILSGYYLERFSMDHSQIVVTAVNNWLNGKKPTATPSQNPFYMVQNTQQQDFGNFVGSINQKQTRRV